MVIVALAEGVILSISVVVLIAHAVGVRHLLAVVVILTLSGGSYANTSNNSVKNSPPHDSY